ncbi:MAG: glycerol-3-phosphate acyltransferase [Chloroflexota bacterium]
MTILLPLSVFLACYVIGSFPSAYVAGRLNHVNIFEMGSGNMGANNVIRALGFKWGGAVWALDSLKGVLAVSLARRLMPSDEIAASVIGAIAVVIGHNWSFLATLITGKLRGGKGAATAAGTWVMMAPAQVILITLTLWAAVVLLTRYVSLGVLVAVAIGSIWMLILIGQPGTNIPQEYSIYIVAVSAMIYIRHWKNIQSLLAGRERRLGDRV